MRILSRRRSVARAVVVALLLFLLSLCMSCASTMPRLSEQPNGQGTILEIHHAYSTRPSDCLSVCVDMVLDYYGVETVIPDTVLPLELVSVSRHLNNNIPTDTDGCILFSAVLELAPEELEAHLARQRPLIIAFKPSARAEYHSVVLSGYDKKRGKFFVNDPARRKPSWKKLSKIPTYLESDNYLVMLIGIREK